QDLGHLHLLEMERPHLILEEDEELAPGGEIIYPGISSDTITELTNCNATLSHHRKTQRQIPSTLALVDSLEQYSLLSSHPLHKASEPGILAADIHPSQDIIASGGVDADVVLFHRTSGQILSSLSGHSKKVLMIDFLFLGFGNLKFWIRRFHFSVTVWVNSVKFVSRDELLVTGSADKATHCHT
ncbi:hypothetical protein IFM89_010527, partial [Coptis chinensis]